VANLKGSTFDKQARDIFFRLKAFGVKRHNNNQNKTHSIALNEKRKEIISSFVKYANNHNLKGKLNSHFTKEHVKQFLNQRTHNLSNSTKENYIRAFSSMIQGLKKSNIDIPVNKTIFNSMVKNIKTNSNTNIITNRAIVNVENKIKDISKINYTSGVIAQVQNELGIRITEAFKIVKNLDKYLNPIKSTINNLIGKGNHIYKAKSISPKLILKIQNIDKMISKRTYQNHLSKVNVKSHDFIYTYAKRLFNEKIARGEDYKQILKDISKELNHSRAEMTNFYLNRV
jgi:hypothetical protein